MALADDDPYVEELLGNVAHGDQGGAVGVAMGCGGGAFAFDAPGFVRLSYATSNDTLRSPAQCTSLNPLLNKEDIHQTTAQCTNDQCAWAAHNDSAATDITTANPAHIRLRSWPGPGS